ncbi:efflux transporter outer membrane subunit [Kangiella sp. TOML190]|uniref:efflux transporter outer membrane subunit n=1 Tax=Kangiella sp. TOML190 TaxID=2931351 RepID=UPI00203C63C9|nr:TolC family protein [Kangiella sp. TOML190]
MKSKYTSFKLTAVCSALFLSGCISLAPDYERSALPVAESLADNGQPASADAVELKAWDQFFTDQNAQRLINIALENNRNLRVAAANVAIARARYQISYDDFFPAIGAQVSQSSQQNSINVEGNENISRLSSANIGFTAYELDFFGKIRSLKDAALADYFSTEEAKRSTQLSLISETANAYYDWLFALKSYELAEQTLISRDKSLDLIERRKTVGIASNLDLAQAQASRASVAAQKAQLKQVLTSRKANLELLIGAPMGSLNLNPKLTNDFQLQLDIPDELDSRVLLNRPDVLSAEQSLIAANANIGAARAAYFPSIRLGGSIGFSSLEFDDLFDGDSDTWSFVPSINIPIFNNDLDSNLEIAKAQKEALLAIYEQTIQLAFAETYQQMENGKTLVEEISANKDLVKAQSLRLDLADQKYNAGLASYIEVLNSQQELFAAQQALLESERKRLAATIGLYRALGGGDERPIILSAQAVQQVEDQLEGKEQDDN